MNLLDARDKLAAALAPIAEDDPTVLVNLVDSIEPPALMLGWGEPWLEPQTVCNYLGRLVVTCVAARLTPGAGVETLEELVEYTLTRLRNSGGAWPLENTSGPRLFNVGKFNYLAARITLRVPITGGA